MAVDRADHEEGDVADKGKPDEAQAPDDPALMERVRHGQTDLDEAIALLRTLILDDLPPAATFDPAWPEAR